MRLPQGARLIQYKRGIGYQTYELFVHMALCFRCGERNTTAGERAGICEQCGYRANDDSELVMLLADSDGDVQFEVAYDAGTEFEDEVRREIANKFGREIANKFGRSIVNNKKKEGTE